MAIRGGSHRIGTSHMARAYSDSHGAMRVKTGGMQTPRATCYKTVPCKFLS